MGVWHTRSKSTASGGRLKQRRSRKKFELGRTPTETVMGKTVLKTIDSTGRYKKTPAMRIDYVNVTDPKKNQTFRAELLDVEKNPANIDYQRRKVITRVTIIKTSKGRARVTSRPGQNGILNAVLI